MRVYYNEFDKKKCAALSQLMKDGHITKGDIDDRSITEVQPGELKGYTRAHFFAGIGLWDYSLNLAGWPEGRTVWTGSCPCQPFSTAGRQKGKADDRHLWPEWFRLIKECRPPTIFGEQVASAITKGWLDDVYQGLEAEDYAIGSVVLPASAVGAPHRRERLWFVGDTRCQSERGEEFRPSGERVNSEEKGFWSEEGNGLTDTSVMGNSEHDGPSTTEVEGSSKEAVQHNKKGQDSTSQSTGTGEPRSLSSSSMGDTSGQGPQGYGRPEQEYGSEGRQGEERYPWETSVWLDCPDGKQRLVEPTIPLLVDGYPERVGILHCAGDAIVPQVAAEVIKAMIQEKIL